MWFGWHEEASRRAPGQLHVRAYARPLTSHSSSCRHSSPSLSLRVFPRVRRELCTATPTTTTTRPFRRRAVCTRCGNPLLLLPLERADASTKPAMQVEYALEAVKQGSACVGLRSNTHVVLLGLKVRCFPPPSLSNRDLELMRDGDTQRSTGELASYQKKLIRIDDHIGVAIAGLTSDARVLSCIFLSQLFLRASGTDTGSTIRTQQLYAHASHVVAHALQPTLAHLAYRQLDRRQCVLSTAFLLDDELTGWRNEQRRRSTLSTTGRGHMALGCSWPGTM